jgi:PAS domain S-box-containing protein
VTEALRRSEARYRDIVEHDYRVMLENIQDVFYRTDAAGNLVLATPSGAKLLGYDGIEAAIGKPVTDYYADPTHRDTLLAALNKEGSVSNVEVTLKRKDGSHIIVSTSSHLYYDARGTFAGVEGIFRDITRFKRVQAEFRQSEELYRVLVSHIQDGAFLMQDGKLLFCNEAFADMIGHSPAEILGTAVPGLVAPEDRAMVMERQRCRLAGESPAESYQFRMLHKDGATRIPVYLSVGTGTYKGRPAVVGTIRDMRRERSPDILKQNPD